MDKSSWTPSIRVCCSHFILTSLPVYHFSDSFTIWKIPSDDEELLHCYFYDNVIIKLPRSDKETLLFSDRPNLPSHRMARAVRRKSANTPMKKGVKHAIKKPKATKKTSGSWKEFWI